MRHFVVLITVTPLTPQGPALSYVSLLQHTVSSLSCLCVFVQFNGSNDEKRGKIIRCSHRSKSTKGSITTHWKINTGRRLQFWPHFTNPLMQIRSSPFQYSLRIGMHLKNSIRWREKKKKDVLLCLTLDKANCREGKKKSYKFLWTSQSFEKRITHIPHDLHTDIKFN